MSVKITTNSHRHEPMDASQLTPAERAEFDYIDWDAIEEGRASAEFLRYRGQLYDLHDTEPGPGSSGMPSDLDGWHAYVSDSYFSGVCFKWVEDPDSRCDWYVIAGTYYAS